MGKGQKKADRIRNEKTDKVRRKKRFMHCVNNIRLVFHMVLIVCSIFLSWQYAGVITKGGEPSAADNFGASLFSAWGCAGIINQFSYKFQLNREKPTKTYRLGAFILLIGTVLAALVSFGNIFWTNFISLIAWIPVNVGLGVLLVGVDHMILDLEKSSDDDKLKKYFK